MNDLVRFHQALLEVADGRMRIDQAEVLRAFHSVAPEIAATTLARARLRDWLDLLVEEQLLFLPKGRESWDTSSLPALPNWIKLPATLSRAAQPDLRTIPWAPELRFLAGSRISVPLDDLMKLQEFFARDGRSRPLVGIKERSIELFGDEKRLDQLYRGSTLFGPGRLTLETLRCFVVPEPLPWAAGVDSGKPLLVLENATTWDSYRRWNKERGLFGAVVYGGGSRFIEGVSYLQGIFAVLGGPRSVFYFGDLDPAGLRIPRLASARAVTEGLPSIEPHLWSYRRLLEIGRGPQMGGQQEGTSEASLAWLGELASPVRQLFHSGKRLAQENIGWEFLMKESGVAD